MTVQSAMVARRDQNRTTGASPRRLTILSLVHNLFFGGDETRLLSFSRSHDSNRFKHLVASIHVADKEYDRRNGSMRDEFAAAGVRVIDLGKRHGSVNTVSARPDHVFRSLQTLGEIVRRLRKLVRDQGIDVIDARLASPILVGSLVARMSGIPVVGTTYSFEGNPSLVRRLARQISFGMCSAVVTDSELWRSRIKRKMLRPGLRVLNIPNGIFPPEGTRPGHEVKRALQVPDEAETRVVCQVSRLVPYKGHATLLAAARIVLERFPNAFFLLVGHDASEQYRRELIDQAEELGIAERVRIGGYSGRIGDIWSIVDIHAHASHLDSLPNAIIEGMSVGKPAVVTSVGGIPDLVSHERTGLVVPPRDASALASGILRMLEQPVEASKLAAAAKQRYLDEYTPATMSRRLEDLFLGLCKQNR